MQKDKKQKTILNWLFIAFALIVVSVFLLVYFLHTEIFKKDMLFWFFSATSQSMAALFAVVGMFLVFRYQDLQHRLEHEIQILRINFMSGSWSQFFGYNHPYDVISCLSDSELLNKAEKFLKDKKEESQHKICNNLYVSLKVIKSHTDVKGKLAILATVTMVTILITFLMSIISLIFIDLYFSLFLMNYLGMAIVLIVLVLIIFSMASILKFFFVSTRRR